MTKFLSFLTCCALLFTFSSCKKSTCPTYWQYPDCKTQSRERFYGLYKGISTLDSGQQNQATTQWRANPGLDVSEIDIASNITLQLNQHDPRYFTIKESCKMDGKYIRQTGDYCGHFTDDSLYLEFWLADGATPIAGEAREHYVFAGVKK